MKIKTLLYACLTGFATIWFASSASATVPSWFEPDSARAIHSRLASDFSLSMPQAVKNIKALYPKVTDADIDRFIDKHYLEVFIIDGKKRMHRKSPRNLVLLNPNMNNWTGRGSESEPIRRKIAADIIAASKTDEVKPSLTQKITIRFSIDVPYNDVLDGDTIKVWMPFPIESDRQSNVELISTSRHKTIRSTGHSVHNTLYMEAPVVKGKPTHFEYTVSYDCSALYIAPEYILSHIKPYDKDSEIYRKYTEFQTPHIVRLDDLAKEIVGEETNPFRQSELVFNYIVKHYPWAGAREYSTIPCIPQYVIEQRHGDCGQVALLYISLMRTLGVPARWESGWMLHPNEKNLHDWAEVYFEGVGWVPIDVSFGRYTNADDNRVVNFYSTGIDFYRFATNKGVFSPLYPAKRYLRSDNVDLQMGEVETTRGNLFYGGWKKNLEILSIKPIEQ